MHSSCLRASVFSVLFGCCTWAQYAHTLKDTLRYLPLRVTLVSVGIHEPYESSLRAIESMAPLLGYYRMLSWRERDFLEDPITQSNKLAFQLLNNNRNQSIICYTWPQFCRPYCASFKPVALMRSLRQARAREYVMWVDSSKYDNYSTTLWPLVQAKVNVLEAVNQLQEGYRLPGPPSMYGAASCERNNTLCQNNGVYIQPSCQLNPDWGPWRDQFERSSLQIFNVSDPCQAANGLWLENPHILLAATAFNYDLVEEWLTMALERPKAFCRSHSQDQAAWSILVSRQNLPLISFQDPYKLKTLSNVLLGLSTGAFKWIDRSVARIPFARGLSYHFDFGDSSLTNCHRRY